MGSEGTVRINKFFTEQGLCSRRAADRLIEEGRVLVNGRRAVLGDQVRDEDVVMLDGCRVSGQRDTVYLAYHKPVGVTCTTDVQIPGNIITAVGYPTRIFPIGRLDKDSSGLILLTNEGDIVNRILRVEFGHEREYVVALDRPYPDSVLRSLAQGVTVLGKPTRPCRTSRINQKGLRITLTEGRNRQIRRMCAALGYRVLALVRVRIMHIQLGTLRVGQWRYLSARERRTLLDAVGAAQDESSMIGRSVQRRTA